MWLKQYLLAIAAAALLCSIVRSVAPQKGTVGATIRMALGIVMLLSVVSPLLSVSSYRLHNWSDDFSYDAHTIVSDAQQEAKQELRRRITEQTQAYILAKAQALGAQLEVSVALSEEDPGYPCSATLKGPVSPSAKQTISGILTRELGIDKEAQQWIS